MMSNMELERRVARLEGEANGGAITYEETLRLVQSAENGGVIDDMMQGRLNASPYWRLLGKLAAEPGETHPGIGS